MKKRYTTIKTFVALLTLSAISMSAQLSGLYTIDKNSPVSVTNFTDFTTFAAALNTLGVSGAVTADVVANSGPYVEQVQFNQITGASATNSILINGLGNTLQFNNSTNTAQPWIMNLNGTDYLNVTNLTVSGLGSNALACVLNGGANFNSFTGCEFKVPNESTSTTQIPVVISGSNLNYFGTSNSGDNNTFTNCIMRSGYFAITLYGMSGSPYNGNNQFVNCQILDFYVYGLYSVYQRQLRVSGCTVERLTRTSLTTCYGIYLATANSAAMIEKNRIRKLFNTSPGFSAFCGAIYLTQNVSSGTGTFQTTVRNNIISDIQITGTLYGIYFSNTNGFIYHNTVSIDYANQANGTTYGIFVNGSASYPADVKNNMTYLRLGGTGTKYLMYYNSTAVNSSNNCWFDQNTGSGLTYYYRAAFYNNLAGVQTAGGEVGSVSANPQFLSPATNNYMPSSYSVNDLGTPVGILDDINNTTRSTTVPDMGAIEFLNVPCSGAPAANSILSPTAPICPYDVASLSMFNPLTYTFTGLTFAWQTSSVSSVGPFAAIPGATLSSFTTPTNNVSTFYNVVVTCTNGGLNTAVTATQVQIANTTTNSVPYFENFEGVSAPGRLPNCSWLSPNIGVTATTYTSIQTTLGGQPNSGTKYASFRYLPAGTSYFYTNGIYLNAGVTYSTGLMYRTEYYGYITWSDLSIMLGTTQGTTGLVTLVSTNGPAVSPSYKSLSGTFTVATSGLYYVAVKGVSSGSSFAQLLSWDDLFITAPCSLNTASVSLTANNTQVCNGNGVTLTAAGAGSYTWSNGATTSAITVTPNFNTTYVVTGTSSLTGCSGSANQLIQVNPVPSMGIFVTNPNVCKGSSVTMNAFGAQSYNWNVGGNSSTIAVSPTVTTSYTVLGVNQFGCQGSAVQLITVKNIPVITTAATSNQMCIGETTTLSASGAGGNNYVWNSISSTIMGSVVVVSPNVSTSYVVSGTNSDGCVSTATVILAVTGCTGLNKLTTTASGVKLYPNPSKGEFNIEFSTSSDKTVEVLDLTGRVIMANSSKSNVLNFNISNLANGIYYVKIQNTAGTEVVKVVKQ
jgi:hypothetical protein